MKLYEVTQILECHESPKISGRILKSHEKSLKVSKSHNKKSSKVIKSIEKPIKVIKFHEE